MSFAAPLSIWHCNEASGTLLDAQLTNDLTSVNAIGAASGKLSGARDWEFGNSNYAHAQINFPASGTVSIWLNIESLPGGSPMMPWGWANSAAGGNQYSGLLGLLSTGKVQAYGYDGAVKTAESTTTLSTGTWYHVVVTWAAGGNLKIYVNGSLEATTAIGTLFNSWSAGPYFVVGGITAGGGFSTYFDGLIDEIVLDNTEWTAGNVTSAYNGGSGATFPIGGGGGGVNVSWWAWNNYGLCAGAA